MTRRLTFLNISTRMKKYIKWLQPIIRKYFSFPFIRGDKSLGYSTGLILRGDWLKELGLEIPRNIDQWETVLTAFKEKKAQKSPFFGFDR
ncbi:MAG: hypothetical protein L6V93_15060 [Clostridiales bacterium]|nr:MAG: hypothetical protein L6V93_15060 [Clostridiales bacterium]